MAGGVRILDPTYADDLWGTYFAAVRMTAQRDGEMHPPHPLTRNLDRVRVVIRYPWKWSGPGWPAPGRSRPAAESA